MAGELEYSTTASSNTSINSIDIQGTAAVLNMDNALRQIMADVASSITRRVAKSTAYTVLKTDHKALIECTAALTLSMTAAATLTDGFMCIVKANGGDVTIDPASSEQIDGANTTTVEDGKAAFVYCDGTAFYTIKTTDLPATVNAIGDLAVTDGNFIVGNGTTWVAESGATVRASLGLTIGTHVQAWDVDLDTYAANPLTAAELGQLQNIGAATISATQWGYLGATDQALATTDNVTFATVTVTG